MPKLIDLTGQRFGRLTVLGRTEVPPNRETQAAWWLCDCDCGRKVPVASYALRSGATRSCGRHRAPDLTGQRFGRLTVLERDWTRKVAAYWLCDCDCGTKTSVAGDALRSGRSQSCGCSRYRRFTGRSDPQLSFRPPLDGRMWLEAHARRTGRSMNTILIEALAEYRARRPGIPVPPSGDT